MPTPQKSLTRREFLHLAGMLAASAGFSACAPLYNRLAQMEQPLEALPESDSAADPALFAALNRLTFGPLPAERRRAAQIGLANWIEEQLDPQAIDDGSCDLRLRAFNTLGLDAGDLFDLSDRLFDNVDRRSAPDELRQATLVRQVYSRRQLYEAMVEFWNDHFNISVEKGDCYCLKTVDDREVIRAHALGKFRDLLWASAHSPAMLVYLDNQSNRKGAPNENYAREVMELHTLGVDNGYTQNDVMELARCLTGWGVKAHFWRGDFTFEPKAHDDGSKVVLGMAIQPAGQAEAEQVLDRLASHPNTAQHIALKLARRFIGDDPPPALVERAAQAFLRTAGDLRAVLRTLLLDGLAAMPGAATRKYKRPGRFVASALRLTGAQTDAGAPIQDFLLRMGQPAFAWPTPDGYPDRSAAWLGNLAPRWLLAYALAHNSLKNTQIDLKKLLADSTAAMPPDLLDALSTRLLGAPLEAGRRQAILDTLKGAGMDDLAAPAALTAALLASPDFQWY